MGQTYERLKQEMKDKEEAEFSPERVLGMSVLEYIRYKNPSVAKQLIKILDSIWITKGKYRIIRVLVNSKTEGVKIRIRRPNGEITIIPPGGDFIQLQTDFSINNQREFINIIKDVNK